MMMHPENTKILSHEAIKRILKKNSLDELRREEALYNRDVLDALEELTGKERPELERLAAWATGRDSEGFFSVRQQLVIAGIFLMTLASVSLTAVWLL